MIQPGTSLKKYNTFGIDVSAKYFASFSSVDELDELLSYKDQSSKIFASQLPLLILGGGSNILFTKNFDGLVLKNEVTGIIKTKEDDEHVYLKVGAGENWHQFVLYCISNGWAGVENLSLIPGRVGASPMQNIGAYGVEIKDVFYELEAYHLTEKKIITFNLNECEFGYRESVFKRKYRGQFIIVSVTYRLCKQPVFQISYGAIRQELERMNADELSIKNISDAVINIRSSKLPDPAVIGNAGSFFKNPTVAGSVFYKLKDDFPGIVGYEQANGDVKLAAGWLIEQCGWKGVRRGDAGCHEKQALVLVNYANATGASIYQLSGDILQSVRDKFNVSLEREVNIL